jgi:uncharacterized protein
MSSQDAAIADVAPPAATQPAPTPLGDRIATLDLIRGLAVLGILAVNAQGFAATFSAYGATALWPFPNEGASAVSAWVVDAFFHQKFIALFSMLFGVSIFLVGGESGDRTRGRLVRRRLFWLLVFALIHGLALWWGDVLLLYAWAGFLLHFARSWKAGRLFATGLTLFLAFGLPGVFGALMLPHAPPEVQAQVMANMHPTPDKVAAVRADIAEAAGSWAGAYAQNFRGWTALQLSSVTFYLPITLGLMMIGLGLFKTGFLSGRLAAWVYLSAATIGGAALWATGSLSWRRLVFDEPLLWAGGVQALISPVVGLGYAAVLILIWKAGLARLLTPLAAAGRMALTNYLTQSLIMTTIFYGGRLGLMGQVDRPGLWLIVGVVWVAQLIGSTLWLARFQMGPLEWVWRRLTYGRRVLLRRDPSP